MNSPIEIGYGRQHVTINPLGGGMMEYYLLGDTGQRTDIVYGYENDEQKAGSMGDVLFPFPGRVENAEYEFEGKKYKLSGLRIKDGHANHGFAKWALWNIENQTENAATLSFFMDPAEYAEKGYPFALKITLKYSLDEDGLTCQAKVENTGSEPAPFGLGFHPYFTVGTKKIDAATLQIPARKLVDSDENQKPTGKLIDIPDTLDFRQPKQIGDTVIDNCFFDLEFQDGKACTVMSIPKNVMLNSFQHPNNEILKQVQDDNFIISVWQDQNLSYLQLYSADTIPEEHQRRALAIEPQTCPGYALNMPEIGLKTLDPGKKIFARWGISV